MQEPDAKRDPHALARLGAVAFAWFAAFGLGQVLLSWAGANRLRLSGESFSHLQMSLQIPPLVLLLVGGAIADRADPRALLRRVHLLALAPVCGLAAVAGADSLSFGALAGYGLALGVGSAFAAPSRDSLLSNVAGANLMRAVTALTIAQFSGQALGAMLGGLAERIGVPALLALQAALLAIGAAASGGLPQVERAAASPDDTGGGGWLAGAATVARTPALRVPVGLVTAIGVFFIGPFSVAFPLIVRDVYRGGASELGWTLATFPIGTILGSFAIRARGGIARKGRAMLLALANGALNLALLSAGLPYWGFLVSALAWGTGGAVFINSSRTLVQEAAPPAQRGRVLAVYQLGFVGSGPLGYWLSGVLCDALGPLGALRACAAGMGSVIALVAALSSARRL